MVGKTDQRARHDRTPDYGEAPDEPAQGNPPRADVRVRLVDLAGNRGGVMAATLKGRATDPTYLTDPIDPTQPP